MNENNYSSQKLHYELDGNIVKIKRLIRSIKMWGLHRTLAKLVNRFSIPIRVVPRLSPANKDFLLVGCGQFGLSTASFFIAKQLGNRFLGCYDINKEQGLRAQKTYGYSNVEESYEDLISLNGARYILIASNHASHTPQAIEAIKKGLVVHLEKPISVDWVQLAQLVDAIEKYNGKLFVGYNRPFAKATEILRKNLSNEHKPMTMQCFIAGHSISPDHWYYNPEEGTRICGNVGHWIDLSVHLLSQNSIDDEWGIQIIYGDNSNREENFSISMSSKKGDVIVVTFSVRGEPFDGVSETISFQHDDLMAKIEDYKHIQLWKKDRYKKYRFWPKDVGHKASVIQMFEHKSNYLRPWNEVYLSTMLMLHITDMVKNNETISTFSFSQSDLKVRELIQKNT